MFYININVHDCYFDQGYDQDHGDDHDDHDDDHDENDRDDNDDDYDDYDDYDDDHDDDHVLGSGPQKFKFRLFPRFIP